MPGHPSLVAMLADGKTLKTAAAALVVAAAVAPAAAAGTHHSNPGHIVEHAPHTFKAA